MDRNTLLRAVGGRFVAEMIIKLFYAIDNDLERHLRHRIRLYWSLRIIQRTSQLDLPTFTDEKTQAQIKSFRSHHGDTNNTFMRSSWMAFAEVVSLFTRLLSIASELTVMLSVFRGHSEAPFLFVGSCISVLARKLWNHVRRPERGGEYFLLLSSINWTFS